MRRIPRMSRPGRVWLGYLIQDPARQAGTLHVIRTTSTVIEQSLTGKPRPTPVPPMSAKQISTPTCADDIPDKGGALATRQCGPFIFCPYIAKATAASSQRSDKAAARYLIVGMPTWTMHRCVCGTDDTRTDRKYRPNAPARRSQRVGGG
jgi:hypothetical protein